jgi:hypothetical protein
MDRRPTGSTLDFAISRLDGHDYLILGKAVGRILSWGANGLNARSVMACSAEESARVLAAQTGEPPE